VTYAVFAWKFSVVFHERVTLRRQSVKDRTELKRVLPKLIADNFAFSFVLVSACMQAVVSDWFAVSRYVDRRVTFQLFDLVKFLAKFFCLFDV